MGDLHAKGGPVEITIEAVVIRADGTREDRGVISYYHKNPLKRWMWEAKRALREAKTPPPREP